MCKVSLTLLPLLPKAYWGKQTNEHTHEKQMPFDMQHKQPHAPYRKWFLTDYLRRRTMKRKCCHHSNINTGWARWIVCAHFPACFCPMCNYIHLEYASFWQGFFCSGPMWCYRSFRLTIFMRFIYGRFVRNKGTGQRKLKEPRKTVQTTISIRSGDESDEQRYSGRA